jgi:hypothetical protein
MSPTNALSADAGLTALIGSGRIFDDVPPGTRPPYLVFTEATVSDWSTGTEEGEAHRPVIEIWSAEKGRREVSEIGAAVRAALASPGPLDAPWHLVSFRHETTRFERDPQTEYYRGVLRFRALVESE